MNTLTLLNDIDKLNSQASVCSFYNVTYSEYPIIVNTETSDNIGRHWVVIVLKNRLYFHSLADVRIMETKFDSILLRYNNQ